ncbi:hypothetical protein [Paenibacillus ehimensis]|uniref:hypothetical protein n=1 Tax=Paenibacillus ehimensis TaxID=79264 RepID=UPI001FE73E17|nr:hypothetical protein [Paenibacillus ehimensis]MEC0212608.1 hypothetical protein [Paenibacillus ehimensis]
MKKSFLKSVFTLTAVSTICMSSFANSSFAAKVTPEQEAKGIVQKYFNAMQEKDFTTAADLVRDLRYPDKKIQLKKYAEYRENTDFNKVQILSVVKESESKVSVATMENKSNIPVEAKVNVIREGDSWKLYLGDGDAATIKALNAPFISTAGSVDYYEFFNVKKDTVLYTTDAFEVTDKNNHVTIKGWQNDGGLLDHEASNKYRVVEDKWYGWKEWGIEEIVNGDSDKNDSRTWYTRTFEGIPNGKGFHIRITGNSSQGYGSDGAGNVYQ